MRAQKPLRHLTWEESHRLGWLLPHDLDDWSDLDDALLAGLRHAERQRRLGLSFSTPTPIRSLEFPSEHGIH